MKRLRIIVTGLCLALFLLVALAPATRVYADGSEPQGGSNSGPRPPGPPPPPPPPSPPPSSWIPVALWELINGGPFA